jgi:hypothetical protein
MPARLKIRVVGETSATTALVATKESPQNTTASSAPSRGGIGEDHGGREECGPDRLGHVAAPAWASDRGCVP